MYCTAALTIETVIMIESFPVADNNFFYSQLGKK